MIDFRYHLVSLVSVFLALAVGIVLGAGPLRDPIASTLTERVESLRQEKDALRAELDTANAAISHRDEFVTTVTPSLISGQLTERSVAIVTLPGVSDDTADQITEAIITAGGTIPGRISIGPAWTDPQLAQARTDVVADLIAELPTGVAPSSGEPEVQLASLLAGALVSNATSTISASNRQSVLEALSSADLITISGDATDPADSALLLAPPMAATANEPEPTEPTVDPVEAYLRLALALDSAGGGTVVTGPASAALSGGVLAALRGDDEAEAAISTVDTGSQPIGVIAAVLALREQLAGSTGAYGFGDGATDPLPEFAATLTVPTPTPTPTQTPTASPAASQE